VARGGRWKMRIKPTLVATFYKMEINLYISTASNKKGGQELLSKREENEGVARSFIPSDHLLTW
jgi:hypothetical protein